MMMTSYTLPPHKFSFIMDNELFYFDLSYLLFSCCLLFNGILLKFLEIYRRCFIYIFSFVVLMLMFFAHFSIFSRLHCSGVFLLSARLSTNKCCSSELNLFVLFIRLIDWFTLWPTLLLLLLFYYYYYSLIPFSISFTLSVSSYTASFSSSSSSPCFFFSSSN